MNFHFFSILILFFSCVLGQSCPQVLKHKIIPSYFGFIAFPFQPGVNAFRNICGTNDMVSMREQFTSRQQMGRPIGRLVSRSGLCSGTLVSEDYFLTARHCYADCSSLRVEFGYLDSQAEQVYQCKNIIEKGKEIYNQDYLLIQLEGKPGLKWGWYPISDKPLSLNAPLLLIHHPGGKPMMMTEKNCRFKEFNGNGLLYHECDAQSGSSGAGVLSPDFNNPSQTRVVAVHTYGGCNAASTSFNSGQAIRYLSGVSQLIRSLVVRDKE